MSEYEYKLTEEISRWAFEVHVKTLHDWQIAFTNPTAGPWKRIVAPDATGTLGEVCRFDREEKRPDIILVNDPLRSILIVEAKDDFAKLSRKPQAEKSVRVVADVARKLRELGDNPFWNRRSRYAIRNGLLWGGTRPIDQGQVEELFRLYQDELLNFESALCTDFQIAIEAVKTASSITLSCRASVASSESIPIIETLKLPAPDETKLLRVVAPTETSSGGHPRS